MEQINRSQKMQDFARKSRHGGKSIALVPTMGFLHEGHLELMRRARKNADLVVVSIFVNPIQFGPGEDLDRYPRDLEGDLDKCKKVGVDVVFTPTPEDLYPEHFQTSVAVSEITKVLCGASRPGHFQGVTTVVAKLFNITLPDFAFFGEKDFQQLAVIRRMVIDLNFPLKIIGVPIVREKDGLAMSSRNAYLSDKERAAAPELYKALTCARELFAQGCKDCEKLCRAVSEQLDKNIETDFKIEYIEIYDSSNLTVLEGTITTAATILIAAHFGKTRLIDNLQL